MGWRCGTPFPSAISLSLAHNGCNKPGPRHRTTTTTEPVKREKVNAKAHFSLTHRRISHKGEKMVKTSTQRWTRSRATGRCAPTPICRAPASGRRLHPDAGRCCGPSDGDGASAAKRSHQPPELHPVRTGGPYPGRSVPVPSLVLTDSLNVLQLISWGRRSARAVLSCTERVEVRHFISQWLRHPQPSTLEKVQAHDADAVRSGSLKAVGNDQVDGLAKAAAVGEVPLYRSACRFFDAVQLFDAAGYGCWTSRRRSVGCGGKHGAPLCSWKPHCQSVRGRMLVSTLRTSRTWWPR